jgi:hypothetical protein
LQRDSTNYTADTSANQTAEDTLAADTTAKPIETKSKTDRLSQKLSEDYAFLKPVLYPDDATYTGMGVVVDNAQCLAYTALFISFILLSICLSIKFIEPEAKKTITFLNILAFLLLAFSRPGVFNCELLWGYWVCLTFIGLLAVYDFYILKKQNKIKL